MSLCVLPYSTIYQGENEMHRNEADDAKVRQETKEIYQNLRVGSIDCTLKCILVDILKVFWVTKQISLNITVHNKYFVPVETGICKPLLLTRPITAHKNIKKRRPDSRLPPNTTEHENPPVKSAVYCIIARGFALCPSIVVTSGPKR